MYTSEQEYRDRMEAVLYDMNNCDSTCEPLGLVPYGGYSINNNNITTEWLINNLPCISYVKERMMNYIFSSGMTTGIETLNERLNAWLYEQKNLNGATNYSVLREAIWLAHVYGESGIRWYEGNIYAYKQGYFGLLLDEQDGVEEIVAYYIRKDRKQVKSDIKDSEWGLWEDYDGVLNWFDRNELILMDSSEFCLLRNDTFKNHGTAILLEDKQRLDLLLATYQRLNYDINYDGPGRYLFWEDSGYIKDLNEVSTTTEVINNSKASKEERYNKAKTEIEEVAKKIKHAGSDAIGVLSRAISKDYLRIPRVTKATEFFNWISKEDVIIAQVVGMSPVLLEAGELHGNVSMTALIDNAMLNSIIPIREKYAIQFSEFIATKLGVPKVYFDKYELQQVEDDDDAREKYSTTIMRLSNALGHLKEVDYDVSVVVNTMNNLAQVIDDSIHDENGNLIPLT